MCSSVARASEKESPSFSYGENVNVHMVEKTTKVQGTYMKLEQNLGRQPLREEVATDMGITLGRLADIVSI